jgi:hypothetical protein
VQVVEVLRDRSDGDDAEHDRADRDAGNRLRMPVTVLQQNWGAALRPIPRAGI